MLILSSITKRKEKKKPTNESNVFIAITIITSSSSLLILRHVFNKNIFSLKRKSTSHIFTYQTITATTTEATSNLNTYSE